MNQYRWYDEDKMKEQERQDLVEYIIKEDIMHPYENMTAEEIQELEDFLAELELQREEEE